MNEQQKKLISDWIDGEIDTHSIRVIYQQMQQDQIFRQTLIRYQIISDHLHGEPVDANSMHIAERVSQTLKNSPPHQSSSKKWALSALAASIAAFSVLIGLQWLGHVDFNSNELSSTTYSQSKTDSSQSTTEERWQDSQPALEQYLKQHSQYAASPNFMPAVVYVSFHNQ